MKTLFTSEAITDDGRSGSIASPDGLLNVQLGNPLEPGIEKRGPNPELLFAGAYAACYHGALFNAAKRLKTPADGSKVRALVSLILASRSMNSLRPPINCLIPTRAIGPHPAPTQLHCETKYVQHIN